MILNSFLAITRVKDVGNRVGIARRVRAGATQSDSSMPVRRYRIRVVVVVSYTRDVDQSFCDYACKECG